MRKGSYTGKDLRALRHATSRNWWTNSRAIRTTGSPALRELLDVGKHIYIAYFLYSADVVIDHDLIVE